MCILLKIDRHVSLQLHMIYICVDFVFYSVHIKSKRVWKNVKLYLLGKEVFKSWYQFMNDLDKLRRYLHEATHSQIGVNGCTIRPGKAHVISPLK